MRASPAPPTLEHEWKAWLSARGIGVPDNVFVADGDTPALRADLKLDAPLVLKAMSPRIVHKSDVRAVRVGIGAGAALLAAVAEMRDDLGRQGLLPIAGFLVEEMLPPGIELLLGMRSDDRFGRLAVFGAGGIAVEALGEARFFAMPLRSWDVDTVLGTIPWLGRALERASTRAMAELREVIWRFAGPSGAALEPDLEALEINPLIAGRAGVVAADVRGRWKAADASS